MTRADKLKRGDHFWIEVPCDVLSANLIMIGKKRLIKIRVEPQDTKSLEFTDDGCVFEFLVRPGREFRCWRDDDDDDDDDDFEPDDDDDGSNLEPVPDPSGGDLETV
jgi:hypothetical protein